MLVRMFFLRSYEEYDLWLMKFAFAYFQTE